MRITKCQITWLPCCGGVQPSTASAMQALEEQGNGRVLVVDAGASYRCAVLGDNLAAMAVKNGWSGLVVNGCIRDSEDIGKMDLGVKALATYPLKSSKRDPGLRDATVSFAGVLQACQRTCMAPLARAHAATCCMPHRGTTHGILCRP